MNLPMNLLCWGVMSMLSLLVWLFLRTATVRITRTSILMLASAVLFTLPILWSPSEGLPTALPRLVGIWGGVMCYVTLLQVPLQEKETTGIFYLLAIAAVVECLISLAGLYCPAYLPFPLNNLAENYSGYAPGIFQQLNVTASFLATGLVALLFVLADARCVCYRVRAESYRLLFICVSIIVISATLVVFHSRTGWLGGLIGILCVSVMFSHPRFRVRTTRGRRLLVVLLPFAGGLLGMLMLNQPLDASLAHESSSNQRMLTLEYTLRMIGVHPWRGWGLGMFEPAFQNFMAALPFDNPSREMMQHPHNETLFIWAEGGVMALAGGLCLLWGWIILFLRRKSLWQWAALLTTLPILLHTQVEFPLYYSVAHYFAILILMASADGELRTFQVRSSRLRWPLVFIALYGLVLSAQLFFASIVLGNFETGRLAFPESITGLHVPGLMQMRYQRDLSQLHLWHFNQTGDIDELERYAKENGEWIKLHMEEDAWNDQVNILLFSHRQGDAEKLKQRAHRLMPWDVRFK
ncbi:membrane protein [Enterobacter asburiae]|nr:membrane protein [Enterobacter asburiae]BCP68939.1 membrane protein [Enterobacter asburiae]